jgi:hypothetical protein
MPAESAVFPGRQRRERKDGSVVFYWVALPKAVAVGFLPKTERLDYPADSEEMSARCIALQAQMERWLTDPARQDRFDGKRVRTIRELIRLYQSDPLSTYRDVGHTTRRGYNWQLKHIDKAVGERVIARLCGRDFRSWYNQFRYNQFTKPTEPGGPDHITKAYHLINMVRTLFTFGTAWRVPEAAVVRDILAKMDFQKPPAREQHLTYEMAVAFIDKALELDELAMALAQALEYDLMLRQTDVIGQWLPKDDEPTAPPEWDAGLRWQHITRPQLILRYKPGKTEETTGQEVVFDLNEHELVMRVLRCFPVIPNIGPMIVNPHTGIPFTYNQYYSRWRKLAALTKVIPKTVWNRDSRAGAVTEGSDAGADLEDLAQHAGHASLETTRRYNRKTLVKTTRVAQLRKEYRNRT